MYKEIRRWVTRREIKTEEEVGKDRKCGEGGNSKMRRENKKNCG